MAKLNDFLMFLEEQVKNKSIYIWGAQGQGYPTLTEAWIKAKESGSNETNALKTYRRAVAAGMEKLCKAFDCSGLGMYWLIREGLCTYDMTANGMMGKCTLIQVSHLKKGDWVFRVYKSGANKGRAYHIGYVVDDDLNVVHAKGRAYGVVKEKFSATYWNAYGRPSYFKNEIDTAAERAEHAAFNRTLKKGMKGDDVRELQKLLNAAGDNLVVDGDFGKKTLAAVKDFQKRKSLKVDGIVGEKTIAALTGAQSATWGCIRVLKRGCDGNDVKSLQTALIKAGYSCGKSGADGSFGKNTEAAVKAYQIDKKLLVDGIAGKETITSLGGAWEA